MEEKRKSDKIINISVADVIRLLRNDKRQIWIYMIIFGVVGIIIAFTTPKHYKSQVMLAPEESGQGFSGSISSLASMVGMNMKIGQTGDAIYPEIYPDVVSATDFTLGMLDVKVTTKKGDFSGTYHDYLMKYCKPAMVDYPKVLLIEMIKKMKKPEEKIKNTDGQGDNSIIWLNREQEELIKGIQHNISCSVDKKTNVRTIETEAEDPLVAAILADSARSRLQTKITEYRTKKSRVDVDYLTDILQKANKDYKASCAKYASYADAHTDVLLKSYSTQQDNLENEMQMNYEIYQQVAEQLQLAKAKLLERTPAFTTLQNATVPVKHSDRPKVLTLAIWMVLGSIIRSCILLWKNRMSFINL